MEKIKLNKEKLINSLKYDIELMRTDMDLFLDRVITTLKYLEEHKNDN